MLLNKFSLFRYSLTLLLCALFLNLSLFIKTNYAKETPPLKEVIISLNKESKQVVPAFTQQRILLEGTLSNDPQKNSFVIPNTFTYSEKELAELNPDNDFIVEKETLSTKIIVTTSAENNYLRIPIYPTKSGLQTITTQVNTLEKKIRVAVTEQSVLAELIKQRMIPPIPGSTLPSLSPRSNPAPPSSAADINLSAYFALNGNGFVDSTHTNVIVPVSPMANFHAGTMWSKRKIDLTKNFEMEMYTYSYNPQPLADGIAVAFQNDPRGLTAIGGTGAGLSLYPRVLDIDHEYVANALALELDPHSNVHPSDGYDLGLIGHHMEYVKPGNKAVMLAQRSHDTYAKAIDNLNLNVNKWRLLRVEWDAQTQKMTTTFSEIDASGNASTEIARLTTKALNTEDEFDGDSVYWGFGASTGALTGTYYMAMKKMPDVMAGEFTKAVKNLTKKETAFSTAITASYADEVAYSLSFKNTLEFDSISPLITDELNDPGQKLVTNSTTYRIMDAAGQQIDTGVISDSNWKTIDGKPTLSYLHDQLVKDHTLEINFNVQLNGLLASSNVLTNRARMTTNIGLNNSSNETTITIPKYDITEKYLDASGNSLRSDKKTTLLSGVNYEGSPAKIPGYTLTGYQIDDEPIVQTTDDANVSLGTVTKNQTIRYRYDQILTLHIRQIISSPSEDLIIPNQGFINLTNLAPIYTDYAKQFFNLTIHSGSDNASVKFSPTQLFKGSSSELTITPIIPEYYQYTGHIVTQENTPHIENTQQKSSLLLDTEKQKNFWITIYLSPSSSKGSLEKLYSWDTKLNQMGRILIE